MLEKILLKAISSSNYSRASHFVQTYNNIRQSCKFFELTVKFRAQQYLPVMYVLKVDLLPKPKEGRIIVNMRRIMNTFGSFSGIVIVLKTIINSNNKIEQCMVCFAFK